MTINHAPHIALCTIKFQFIEQPPAGRETRPLQLKKQKGGPKSSFCFCRYVAFWRYICFANAIYSLAGMRYNLTAFGCDMI